MPIPPDLDILFPNGMVEAGLMYYWDGSKPVVWDGTIAIVTTGSAIEDGVSAAIKATVLDLTTTNPLTVAIVDANGDQIASFGGGTQYTEDAAAAANPVGTAVNLIRQDTPAALVTTDGDNVAQRGTNYGAGFVQILTSAGAFVDSFGGGTQYTEDVAAAADPIGTALNLIRQDTPSATTVTTDGDNIAARAASTGAQYVEILGGTTKLGSSTDGLLVNLGANNDITVASLPLPSGAATLAEQQTQTTSLSVMDDWDETDRAKVNLVAGQAGVAAGTGVDAANVLRVSLATNVALPAGTNNIGDIDVLSSALPTGAATLAEQQTQTASLSVLDDWDETDRAKVNIIAGQVAITAGAGAVAANTPRTTLASDDPAVTALQIMDDWDETNRAAVNTIAGQVGVQGASGTSTALTQRVVLATDIALPAGDNNIGNVDIVTVPAPLSTTGGGTEATALRVTVASDSTGVLSVDDNGGSLTVDAPVGTPVNVQIGNATLVVGVVDETGASAVDALAVGGGTPHDSVDSGSPIKIGLKALSALPTAVATADRANGISDLWGRQLVSHIDPAMQTWKSFNATSTQTGIDVWSPAAGKKIAITSISVASYGTTAARLILWFGDNADTTYTAGTDQLLFAGSYAPSATSKPGTILTFSTPVFCTTADRELHITTDAALSVDIAVYGYEW